MTEARYRVETVGVAQRLADAVRDQLGSDFLVTPAADRATSIDLLIVESPHPDDLSIFQQVAGAAPLLVVVPPGEEERFGIPPTVEVVTGGDPLGIAAKIRDLLA